MSSGQTKRLIFFGNERLVSGLRHTDTPILRGLIEQGYNVVAIVSHHSDSSSRNNRELEVAAIAREHDIPVFLPNRPAEIIDDLRALRPDAAILVAYGRIIGQSIIDIFPDGIINIHPSLLPKYRGPTPIEAPILHGDDKTGVSIMQLTSGMDEGPVYAQTILPLSGDETKFDLYDQVAERSAMLLFESLPAILNHELQPTPQDSTQASYCQLIKKEDGVIDWNKPAMQLEREVRAYASWPQSRTTFGQTEAIVTKARVVTIGPAKPGELLTEKDRLFVGTGTDWLEIIEIKPLGKKEMPAGAFLMGYRQKLQA